MKGKKILFLTLALLLPAAIFVFLKMFGRNEFGVSPLHHDGGINAPENCQFEYTSPYTLPDSIFALLKTDSDSLYILYFGAGLGVKLNRVEVELPQSPIQIDNAADLTSLPMDPVDFRRCVLLMDPEHSIVLIDHHQRIRGYYDGSEREEIDRLIVELNVILKRY